MVIKPCEGLKEKLREINSVTITVFHCCYNHSLMVASVYITVNGILLSMDKLQIEENIENNWCLHVIRAVLLDHKANTEL